MKEKLEWGACRKCKETMGSARQNAERPTVFERINAVPRRGESQWGKNVLKARGRKPNGRSTAEVGGMIPHILCRWNDLKKSPQHKKRG